MMRLILIVLNESILFTSLEVFSNEIDFLLAISHRLGTELGFEDPNLTAAVSDNLVNFMKRKQIPCA